MQSRGRAHQIPLGFVNFIDSTTQLLLALLVLVNVGPHAVQTLLNLLPLVPEFVRVVFSVISFVELFLFSVQQCWAEWSRQLVKEKWVE